ncbi:hypothetical protein [Ahrensia sp. R2A130]|uniref:hypothetical protein n=1 Tax=Ahrensia sp. R2A130 TaxID=744979 RepID=UPI0001E0E11A|nr:hypothetical protein [Ahrensia sp. R2A130]EFL87561.1 putative dehydrogenase protein [Ahrensia sp. R2A130]
MEPTAQQIDSALAQVRDLRDMSDFCDAWPQIKVLFEPSVFAARDGTPEIDQALAWLIEFADKLCVFHTSKDT